MESEKQKSEGGNNMRRLKNSFAALLALVMTIACFSTVVNADGDFVESGTVEGKFEYVLHSNGLLEINALSEVLDITDSFNWDKLGYVTSIKVDFSMFHNTLCVICCNSKYCNISSFKLLIHPKTHESTETICNIYGFPKFTGAENSVDISEPNGTHLRINKSNITSLDFLKGYNLQGFQLTDCDQLESAVVSGDYNYVIFDNCDKLSKLDLRGCTKNLLNFIFPTFRQFRHCLIWAAQIILSLKRLRSRQVSRY